MKKQIDKKIILITGISAVFVFLGILSVTTYYLLLNPQPLLNVVKVLFFEINIQLGFFLINSIIITILCLDFRHNKLSTNYYFPVFVLSVLMLAINLILFPKNIMAISGGLFWLLYIIFQYQNKKAKEANEAVRT